jgi:ribosome-binding factor A
MMSTRKPSRKDLRSSCDEISEDDGLDSRRFLRPARPRVPNRKALQLSGQVMDTLSYALAWECRDEVLQDLTIVSVVPAPNSTRLLVTVRQPPDRDPALVREHLQRASGMLRAEAAAAIHRKRVPELTFQIAPPEEAG